MDQHVNFCEAGDDRVGGFFSGVEAVERGGKRREVGVVDVGLKNLRREADYGESGVEEGAGDVDSEAAVGSGDERCFCGHG